MDAQYSDTCVNDFLFIIHVKRRRCSFRYSDVDEWPTTWDMMNEPGINELLPSAGHHKKRRRG